MINKKNLFLFALLIAATSGSYILAENTAAADAEAELQTAEAKPPVGEKKSAEKATTGTDEESADDAAQSSDKEKVSFFSSTYDKVASGCNTVKAWTTEKHKAAKEYVSANPALFMYTTAGIATAGISIAICKAYKHFTEKKNKKNRRRVSKNFLTY